MKNKHKHRDAYHFVHSDVMEDGDPPLYVPLHLADHSFRGDLVRSFAADADRSAADWKALGERRLAQEARQQMIDRQRVAWRGPQRSSSESQLDQSRRKPPDDPDEDDDDEDEDNLRRERSGDAADARAGARAAYDAMSERAQNAGDGLS
jgi:hypothetical protein